MTARPESFLNDPDSVCKIISIYDTILEGVAKGQKLDPSQSDLVSMKKFTDLVLHCIRARFDKYPSKKEEYLLKMNSDDEKINQTITMFCKHWYLSTIKKWNAWTMRPNYLYDLSEDEFIESSEGDVFKKFSDFALETQGRLVAIEICYEALKEASNYEKSLNYEKAATIYEEIGWWNEAARVRAGKPPEKKVVVNVNELIEQLKTSGLALNFKCNNCGAAIILDKGTQSGGPKFCQYCGGQVDTEALIEFLKKALG